MSEMIERVAAAIRESEAYWRSRDDEPDDGLAETLARAALKAMREPTEAMTAKACMVWPGHPAWEETKKEWREQIDIALDGTTKDSQITEQV